jgi:hypothetical protein
MMDGKSALAKKIKNRFGDKMTKIKQTRDGVAIQRGNDLNAFIKAVRDAIGIDDDYFVYGELNGFYLLGENVSQNIYVGYYVIIFNGGYSNCDYLIDDTLEDYEEVIE